jgi:inner membrane protein
MASFFGHSMGALAIGYCGKTKKVPWRFWFLAILCGFIPDADVIGYQLGIPYGSMLGHRGFSHSILFALIMAGLALLLFLCGNSQTVRSFRLNGKRYYLVFFFIMLSHSLFDALTTGGHGVGFFIPYSEKRYFFPWRPILVSPLGIQRFFTHRGLEIILNVTYWIGLPSVIMVALVYAIRIILSRKQVCR